MSREGGAVNYLENHGMVSLGLALELEGAAFMADASTEEFLRAMLDKFGRKEFKEGRSAKFRERISELYGEGFNDSEIARELGVSQQAVSRQRRGMGFPPQPRKAWNKGMSMKDYGREQGRRKSEY